MKKIYLLLVMVLGLMAVNTKAQMSSYIFTPSSGTFTAITGGTAVSTTVSVADFLGDTKTSIAIPLGFSFKFDGVNYSSVTVMSDGFISFNPLATTVVTNNLSTSTANSRPLVAPLWDDLDGASGTGAATYKTQGAVGSRIFTMEWLNWQWNYNATGATISFQVKLYEGTNAIEFIYQQETGAISSPSASIGISSIGTGAGNFISLNNSTAAPTTSTTTETTGINLKPATGQIYRFEPNPVIAAMDYVNLESPQAATIALGASATIYTQGYEPGVTEAAGAGTGVQAWIGVNSSNTNPATWTTWAPATFNVQVGNNDEFQAAIGSTFGAGTYYYASRWQLNTGEYRYGGYPNGFWNGTTQTSGVLTVTPTLANDVCSGAIGLTVNADLACGISTAGTTVGATQSPDLPVPTCSATGINDDVWFSFVATGASHVVTITGATNTTAAQVYGGSCGSLSTIVCGSTSSGTVSIFASGLVSGNTYLVRVYSTSTTLATTSNFTICIGTPPPPPANDNICGAVSLSVSGNPTCTTLLTGQSTQYSTQSLAACAGTADEDIWYTFVATGTSHIITITSSGAGSTDRVHQLFSSSDNTCNGTLTSLNCSDPETSTVTGLTIGNTYFLRVYSYGSGNFATFDICITTPLPPPANDNICGAVSLSVSGNPTCTTSLTGQSTQFATQSLAGCVGTADEDIWYSFVATNTTHIITLTSSGTGSTDRVHQLFSSSDNTCNGTLTSLNCSDPETSTVTGLTIGNTYFLRVFSYGSGNFATFDLCVTSPAACPAPTAVSASNITMNGATINFTGTGTVILEYGLTGFTPGTGATAGTGGTIINPATSPQAITGLTHSTAYQVYLRQDCTGSGNGFSANSTVVAFTTPPPPPANDNCAAAATIGTTAISVTSAGATQTIAAEVCAGFTSSSALDVWFSFVAISNGTATVNVTNPSALLDVVIQVYSGSCGAFTNIGCADATTAGATEVASLTGLIAGQTYFVRVYGYNGLTGTFDISVTGAALPITIEYFKGSKQNGRNLLDWKVSCYGSPNLTMELERSTDGRSFRSINSQTETAARCLQPFNFTDISPLPGLNYYRLKSVDIDGKINYSNIVALLNKDKGFEIVSLVPNPVKEEATLSVTSATKSIIEIVVTDISGKQLSKQRVSLIAGNNLLPLSVRNLPAGSYQVTGITEDGASRTLRFVKQ